MIALTAVLFIVFGLFICFFGYLYWRVMLALAGAVLGFAIGSEFAAGQEALGLILGVVFGIVGFLLAYFVWSLGVIIAGGLLGASIGAAIAVLPAITPGVADSTLTIVLMIVGAVAGILLAALLKDVFVVYITAFAGAGLVVRGLALLLPSVLNVTFFNDVNNVTVSTLITLVLWVVLALAGVANQMRSFTRRGTYSLGTARI